MNAAPMIAYVPEYDYDVVHVPAPDTHASPPLHGRKAEKLKRQNHFRCQGGGGTKPRTPRHHVVKLFNLLY